MIQHRAAQTLSGGGYEWLKARHHFRVTQDGDPAHGPLADMEIITFVREGTVTHRRQSRRSPI